MIFRIICLFIALLSLNSCESVSEEGSFESSIMPIRIDGEQDTVHLSDLLLSSPPARFTSEDVDVTVMDSEHIIVQRKSERSLGVLSFESDGLVRSAPLFFPNRKSFALCLPDSNQSYTDVQLKGQMTSWRAEKAVFNPTKKCWEIQFSVSPGRYQYVFVVDGKEITDPTHSQQVVSDIGTVNSLLEYQLDQDPNLCNHSQGTEGNEVLLHFSIGDPDFVVAMSGNQEIPVQMNSGRGKIDLSAIPSWAESITVYHELNGVKGNDLLIPVRNGKLIKESAELQRTDWHRTIMYFTLVDRFNNGNSENDERVEDERVLDIANYFGGDLAGIRAKIEDGYFEKLGINSIWLSPITQNPLEAYQEYPAPHRWYSGYHGYWPIESNTVDHRFGTEEELRQLVKVAHENGMNVFLDYICNHVHENHRMIKQHPEWATKLILEDSTINIRIWEEQRLTTWFDDFLPSLDFTIPAVVDMQVDSAYFWLESFDLDGYRHDATKHVPEELWRALTAKIRSGVGAQGKRVFQIGETFGSRDLIASYLGSGLLDAQFDFALYFEMRSALLDDKVGTDVLAKNIQESLDVFGHHHLMGNITGNHDIPRFISLAGGALKPDEDAREAGFSREIGVGDKKAYHQLTLLHSLIHVLPGIPVVYYGDEIGMPGAGDPDNRRMMRFEGWSDEEQGVYDRLQDLMDWRNSELALVYGTTEIEAPTTETIRIKRSYLGDVVELVLNIGGEPAELESKLPNEFEPLWQNGIEPNDGIITMPAYSSQLFRYASN